MNMRFNEDQEPQQRRRTGSYAERISPEDRSFRPRGDGERGPAYGAWETDDYSLDRGQIQRYGRGAEAWAEGDQRGGWFGDGDAGYGRYDQTFRPIRERHSTFGFGYDLTPDQAYGRGDAGRPLENHRGRGPQGYRRSDARISEDVNDRLCDDARLDACGVMVAVKDGEVTLSGTVASRTAKHLAEYLVEDLSGVMHVQNNLRVADRKTETTTGESGSKMDTVSHRA